MIKTSKALWLAPLLGMLAMPVLADDDDHKRYGHRDDRQHVRIEHGIHRGELTRKEAKKLRHEQRHIAKAERRYARDGHFDRHERRDLKQGRDHASRHIYRLKHNDRDGHHKYGHRDRGHHYGWYRHPHHAKHRHYWSDHRGYRDRYPSRGRYDDDAGWWVMFGLHDRL